MPAFYIIYSIALDKYYSGITTEDVQVRLQKHNNASYGTKYTLKVNDWTVKLVIHGQDFAHVRRMELYVKKRKSRAYIIDLVNNSYLQILNPRGIFIGQFNVYNQFTS